VTAEGLAGSGFSILGNLFITDRDDELKKRRALPITQLVFLCLISAALAYHHCGDTENAEEAQSISTQDTTKVHNQESMG
jgi:hypothetical protein